jgi:hypothetical protein
MTSQQDICLAEPRKTGFPMEKATRVTCREGHSFIALADHPKGPAGDYHCPHCDQGRIYAAVSASTRLQEQRDQVTAQLKDATHQCGVQAELLRESRGCIEWAITSGIYGGDALLLIDALLEGKDNEWSDRCNPVASTADYRALQADHDYLKTLLHRRGFHTMMALADTLEKPLNGLALTLSDGSTAVSTKTLRALASEMLTLPSDHTGLSPVEGDQLPAMGETVHIHLSSINSWEPYRVVGFYAWGDLDGDKALHRVFVQLISATGTQNCRLLCDIRRNHKEQETAV